MVFPLRLRHELLGIMLCHIIIHVAGAALDAQCPSHATPANYTTILQREAIDYEQSSKFRNKIDELHGKRYVDWEGGRIGEVVYGLRALIRPGKTASILDLGCASGLITLWAQGFASSLGSNAEVWGVELVPGWVSAAKSFANGRATFIQGDLTAITRRTSTPGRATRGSSGATRRGSSSPTARSTTCTRMLSTTSRRSSASTPTQRGRATARTPCSGAARDGEPGPRRYSSRAAASCCTPPGTRRISGRCRPSPAAPTSWSRSSSRRRP